MSLVDPSLELTDPTPDPLILFKQFDKRFFNNTLSCVEVQWSSRLYVCAGLCTYKVRRHSSSCVIKLSRPLLKLRPRKDLIETLLHEMIHAYVFVVEKDFDRTSHGPLFQSHMRRINQEAGTNITIYHSFHAEVASYKQHWWRCDGRCQRMAPFYGYVKRSSNRKPGPNDLWWNQHRLNCGGQFVKIKEPEGYGEKKKSTRNENKKKADDGKENKKPTNTIDKYFKKDVNPIFPGTGRRLGSSIESTSEPSVKRQKKIDVIVLDSDDEEDIIEGSFISSSMIICPSCNLKVPEIDINQHLDQCLA